MGFLLVADVGGTHARFAHARIQEGEIRLEGVQRFVCAEHAGLDRLLQGVLSGHAQTPDAVIIAIAGVQDGPQILNANLPWPVCITDLKRLCGEIPLHILNDFEALAWSAASVDDSAQFRLCGPEQAASGPVLFVGPGTGFGAAIWCPQPSPHVLASEAGHIALAAHSDQELAIVRQFAARWSHVDIERALSGPGLLNIYQALCAEKRQPATLSSPAAIADAGLKKCDLFAEQAIQQFCAWLGSVCGDLAVAVGAKKIYLAGGIPAQIPQALQQSEFARRFLNKGALRPVLERVPVHILMSGEFALMGAAAWWINESCAEAMA